MIGLRLSNLKSIIKDRGQFLCEEFCKSLIIIGNIYQSQQSLQPVLLGATLSPPRCENNWTSCQPCRWWCWWSGCGGLSSSPRIWRCPGSPSPPHSRCVWWPHCRCTPSHWRRWWTSGPGPWWIPPTVTSDGHKNCNSLQNIFSIRIHCLKRAGIIQESWGYSAADWLALTKLLTLQNILWWKQFLWNLPYAETLNVK